MWRCWKVLRAHVRTTNDNRVRAQRHPLTDIDYVISTRVAFTQHTSMLHAAPANGKFG